MAITVLKIGGSLGRYPDKLRKLCLKVSELAKKRRLLVVPGGGEFADTVRQLDQRFHLSSSVSHRMAILGMNQYGLLLRDLIPDSIIIERIDELEATFIDEKIPVFLPASLMFDEDPLDNSWDVTSDSIAAYIANKIQASKLLIITDVDGIYTNEPKKSKAKLIKEISPDELLDKNKSTCIDSILPGLLQKYSVECSVINGLFADRLEDALYNNRIIGTLIVKKKKKEEMEG